MDWDFPSRLAYYAAMAVLLAVVVVFSLTREPAPPPDQAILDGIYVKEGCPSFEIHGGDLIFEGGRISGQVDQIKSRYIVEARRGLRFAESEDGCRLLAAGSGALIAVVGGGSPAPNKIELFSEDSKRAMVWTQVSLPVELPASDAEVANE